MSAPASSRRRGANRLSRAARAAVIERLHEEFDILCLGVPTAWRIEQAIAQAEGAPA